MTLPDGTTIDVPEEIVEDDAADVLMVAPMAKVDVVSNTSLMLVTFVA